jgi:hypothetical protein
MVSQPSQKAADAIAYPVGKIQYQGQSELEMFQPSPPPSCFQPPTETKDQAALLLG